METERQIVCPNLAGIIYICVCIFRPRKAFWEFVETSSFVRVFEYMNMLRKIQYTRQALDQSPNGRHCSILFSFRIYKFLLSPSTLLPLFRSRKRRHRLRKIENPEEDQKFLEYMKHSTHFERGFRGGVRQSTLWNIQKRYIYMFLSLSFFFPFWSHWLWDT